MAWKTINLTGNYTWDKLLPEISSTLRALRLDNIASRFKSVANGRPQAERRYQTFAIQQVGGLSN